MAPSRSSPLKPPSPELLAMLLALLCMALYSCRTGREVVTGVAMGASVWEGYVGRWVVCAGGACSGGMGGCTDTGAGDARVSGVGFSEGDFGPGGMGGFGAGAWSGVGASVRLGGGAAGFLVAWVAGQGRVMLSVLGVTRMEVCSGWRWSGFGCIEWYAARESWRGGRGGRS